MIKIAINRFHKNKMPDLKPHQMKDWWREFNGNFKNFNLPSTEELIRAIQKGYAYAAPHERYRKRDNFICGQHIGLDYDTGDARSLPERLAERDFFRRCASFIHTTASSTRDNPRARVIFILERPIYSKEKYELLTEAFANVFSENGGADPSCKDPVRLFFGSEGCEVLNLGNTLTLSDAAEIVLPYKKKISERSVTRQRMPSRISGDANPIISSLLNKLATAPDGEKWYTLVNVSRAVGGYVGAGYVTEHDAKMMLSSAISSRAEDMSVAEKTIDWGISVGKQDPIYLEEDLDPILRGIFS